MLLLSGGSGLLIFVFLLFVLNAFGLNRFLCFRHTFIFYKLIRVIFFAGNVADQTGFFRHIAFLTLPSSLLTILNNIRLVSETQVQHLGSGIDRSKEEEDRQCGKKSGSEVEVVPDTPQTLPIRFVQHPQVLAARRSADHHKIGQSEAFQELTQVGRKGQVQEGQGVQPLESADEAEGGASDIFENSQQPQNEGSQTDAAGELHQLQTGPALVPAVGVEQLQVYAGVGVLNGKGGGRLEQPSGGGERRVELVGMREGKGNVLLPVAVAGILGGHCSEGSGVDHEHLGNGHSAADCQIAGLQLCQIGYIYVEAALKNKQVSHHHSSAIHHWQSTAGYNTAVLAHFSAVDPHSRGTDSQTFVVAEHQGRRAGHRTGSIFRRQVELGGTGKDALIGEGVEKVAVGTGGALNALTAGGLAVEDVAVDAGQTGKTVGAGTAGRTAGYTAAGRVVGVAAEETGGSAGE